MADDVSTGELARRLDDIHRLLQGLVSRVEYTADQRHMEHRFTEIESDVADLRRTHADDVKELARRLDEREKAGGTNFRQGIYSGLLPAMFLLVGILVQIGLAMRGGR